MTLAASIVILGILVSIIFYELTDISPGGIIVPGLMVLYIDQIDRMIYTVIIAIITCYVVKLISKHLIIFGKRKFVFMIIVSLIINFILSFILKLTNFNFFNISLVGYTISGLIASDISKQGIKKTVPSLAIVICIIELIVLVAYQIGV